MPLPTGETPGSEAGLNYISMYIFAEAMKAAGNVDDAEKIQAQMQAGVENIPDNVKIYDFSKFAGGGFDGELEVAAIEDGKIVPIKLSK
jgi:branched-chain amino acid transport system substrate-binding protein